MNWFAVVWLLMALAGVVLSWYCLRDIRLDVAALGTRNGWLRAMLIGRRRRERVRMISLMCLVVSAALVIVPGTSLGEQAIVFLCLYVGTAGLILDSLLEQIDRATLRKMS